MTSQVGQMPHGTAPEAASLRHSAHKDGVHGVPRGLRFPCCTSPPGPTPVMVHRDSKTFARVYRTPEDTPFEARAPRSFQVPPVPPTGAAAPHTGLCTRFSPWGEGGSPSGPLLNSWLLFQGKKGEKRP